MASLTETREAPVCQTNQMYQVYNLQLSSYPRASAVAKGYQLYRIKRVTFKISPLLDTFAAGSNTTVPYLYYMIDRTKNLQFNNTALSLQKAGAKPRRLDDKIVTFSFKPSVLTPGFDSLPPAGQSNTQFTSYRISPWLTTRDNDGVSIWNPDSTDHLGVKFMAEQTLGTNITYKVEVLVDFEFKKPAYDAPISEELPAPADLGFDE